jgi:TRAP-type C4-dicarboxylate transport system permease small subunit
MRYLLSLVRVLLGSLMLLAVAINFANVVGRYAFSAPIFWAEEALVFLDVWCVLLGAALVAQSNTHLRMDAFEAILPRALRRWADMLTMALLGAVALLLVWISGGIVAGMAQSDQRSVALELPMALPYAALPTGFALIALIALARLARLARRREPQA